MKKNRILIVLAALCISVGLWLFVVNTVNPYDESWVRNIPVTFTGQETLTDRGLIATSGTTARVSLRFHGKRQDLQKLTNESIAITADLSQVTDVADGTWDISYDVSFPDSVSSSGIQITSRSIAAVPITVSKLLTKEVQVRGQFNGTVAAGYLAEAMTFDYDTVEVSGPESIVNHVSYTQVVLERTNLSKTVTATLPISFMDESGDAVVSDLLTCSVESINVTLPIVVTKEVPLTVELISGGGATSEDAVTTIEPSKITLSGDAAALDAINSISVASVDLATVQDSMTETYNIVIPDGTQSQSSGLTATVTVELKNLTTKTLRTTNVTTTNVPAGMVATVEQTSLEVTVRGPAASVEAVKASNVRVVADMSSFQGAGSYSVEATVYVDGYSDVGALNTYTVLVTMADAATAAEASPAASPATSELATMVTSEPAGAAKESAKPAEAS